MRPRLHLGQKNSLDVRLSTCRLTVHVAVERPIKWALSIGMFSVSSDSCGCGNFLPKDIHSHGHTHTHIVLGQH